MIEIEKIKFSRRQSFIIGFFTLFSTLSGCRREKRISEEDVLKAVENVLLPKGGAIPFSAEELNVHGELLQFISTQREDVRENFRKALKFVNIFPVFELKFKNFIDMSEEERKKYFTAWAKSRLGIKRMIYQALKGAITFAYFSHPEVWQSIGYDGPWT